MADLSDIEQALADRVTTVIYPEGLAAASVIGSTCRIFRGWPTQTNLANDLSAGVINITIVPDERTGRTTTRYLTNWMINQSSPGTALIINGNSVEVAGTPTVGDVVGLLINGAPYAYRVSAGDTVALVAAGLANKIAGTPSVSVNGSNLIFNEPVTLIARVVCDAGGVAESRRQEKDIRIICWCPDPNSRDAVASTIDQALAQLTFLLLPDQSNARMIYRDTTLYDQSQNAKLYRRDLVFTAEYATIMRQNWPSMLFGNAAIDGASKYG